MERAKEPAANGTNHGLRMMLGDVRGNGPRALAESLASTLRQAVRDGRLPAGTALPASRSLAADLAVSRGVIVRAYEQLTAEGYLTARTGQGTVVGELRRPAGAAPTARVPANDMALPPAPGLPAMRWFPRRAWLRALETALAELPDAELGYGDPRGHPRLRQALSGYLGRTRAVVAPADQIVVTGGYAQAIRLIGEALRQHGFTQVGVEEPGSIGVATTLRVAGLSTRPVPVDEDGLLVDELAGSRLRAVVVTPAHQFPTGAVLAPARRSALLAWASAKGAVVVEDDYDAEYRYDRSPVGALQGLSPDRVLYGGSVSKTLAPGLRLGWVVAPPRLAGALAEAKMWSDIATPVLDQVALAVLIETGVLDRHIRQTAGRYASSRERLVRAVATHLPGWTVTGIAAGLHAVLVPPGPVAETALRAAAESGGSLVVVPLTAYCQDDARGRSGLVIGYGAATPDQIVDGVAALATRLRQLGG